MKEGLRKLVSHISEHTKRKMIISDMCQQWILIILCFNEIP